MKKIIKLIFLLLLTITLTSCFNREERIANKIKANLLRKYGEEFIVTGLGKRSSGAGVSWYECRILPARYVGTTKEYDQYYWASGFYSNGSPGDSYGEVLMQESANAFYGQKIEELFGKNYISAIIYEGGFDYTDWKRELEAMNEDYRGAEERGETIDFAPIRGSIYVFGRVESEADREVYRQKIFEFIKYLKETGSFQYTAMWLVVLDERVLSDGFSANALDQFRVSYLHKEKGKNYIEKMRKIAFEYPADFDTNPAIIKMLERLYNREGVGYLRERAEIMDKYTESFNNTSEKNKQKVIDEYGKWDIGRKSDFNSLLVAPLVSPKHVKARGLNTARDTNYEMISDVHFTEEIYYRSDVNE